MLTAIQDFVRDSFEGTHKDGGGGIDTLRLGDLLLWCEEGPFAFLAAVIRGNPPESLHTVLRETLTHIHDQFRSPLEEFQGDAATLGDLVTPLESCLQQRERPRETQLSPWLWIIPLVLLLVAGVWMIQRTIDRARVDAYVQRLREEPGIVVTSAEFRDGKWQVSGLRDPLAADPAVVLSQSGLNSKHVVGHWESYQALDPAIVLRRLAASLNPPPSVSLSVNGSTVQVTGSAPQYWVERAKMLVAALPAGSPKVDFSALTDVQDPEFLRLRDAIQGHIISFDSNADRPARGQDATLDAVADEFRQLMRVANRLGFSVRAMISGHADANGNETANLSLSAARAEVVRSMLRARGIAPELLTVRSAGPLEPVQAPNGSTNRGDESESDIHRDYQRVRSLMLQKKVCMLGGFGVGKTSLVRRYVQSIFSDTYLTTVGVKIEKKMVNVGAADVALILWDIAGEDEVNDNTYKLSSRCCGILPGRRCHAG